MYNIQKLHQLDMPQTMNLLKSGELNFFNFYNSDIPIAQHCSVEYYLNHPKDVMDVDQLVNVGFTDIELYNPNDEDFDFDSAHLPINAITLVDTFSKHYHAYLLLYDINAEKFGISNDPNFDFNAFIAKIQIDIKKVLIDYKYIDEDSDLTVYLFNQEEQLLQAYWAKLMEIDPCLISGWNSDGFDYPYLYTRTQALFGQDRANAMMTRFGQVTRRGKFVSFPEYTILDLLHAYKPRDEGGLNLGKKSSQYTLDAIATNELGLKKIEYKSENVSLNDLYENDPYWFLIYNIVDTALTYLLDKKLKHIDLYNGIRRIMKTGYAASIAGSSAVFDSLVYSKLIERGQYVRYGINTELRKNLDENNLGLVPKLFDPKGKPCKIPKIQAREYSKMLTRFPGAYVKLPNPVIINDGSLVIDLDAKALYPSMILQGNISFDSYIARILPVCTYKTLHLLETQLGNNPTPAALAQSISTLCWGYGETVKAAKRETSIKMYNTIMYLFDRVFSSGLNFQQICNPAQFKDHVYLRHYVIPLLDALNMVHPENMKYSQFAYDYLFMDRYDSNNVDLLEHKYPYIYILYDPSDANARIVKYPLVEGIKEFQKYGLTLAGTLFNRHSDYMGLFANFLTSMGNLRKHYKDARQTCERGSDAYNLNDNRQKSIKVVMNTTYGLYGLATFRYSNHWLAQSITNNGMLTIKIAQQLGEDYLQYKYGNQQIINQ